MTDEPTLPRMLHEAVFLALMMGFSEAFFVADAVRLEASALEVGLVVSLPLFLGAAGPGVSLAAMRRGLSRRRLAIGGAVGQAIVLTLVAAAQAVEILTPRLLIGLVCGYFLMGQVAGTAWSAWVGDVVPAERRGAYFATRTRRVHIGTVLGLLAAGSLLQIVGGAGAFAAVFGAAAIMRFVSAGCFASCPEPEATQLPRPAEARRALRTAQGRVLLRLVVAVLVFQFSVYLAAPYFADFMLTDLGFGYGAFTAATLAVGVGGAMALSAWGRAIDRYGPRATYLLAVLIISVVPIPWFAAQGLWVVVAAQVFCGFGWAAYEVGLFSLMLDLMEPGLRPYAVAMLALATGAGQLLGSLVGASVVVRYGFIAALGVTLGARLLVSAVLPALVPDLTGIAMGRRRLLLRVIGIRPNIGIAHRILLLDPLDDPDGRHHPDGPT